MTEQKQIDIREYYEDTLFALIIASHEEETKKILQRMPLKGLEKLFLEGLRSSKAFRELVGNDADVKIVTQKEKNLEKAKHENLIRRRKTRNKVGTIQRSKSSRQKRT